MPKRDADEPERCRFVGKVFIPGCMGAAAAGGCGKTHAQVMNYCTCPPRTRRSRKPDEADLVYRIEDLERELAEVKRKLAELRLSAPAQLPAAAGE